MRNLILIIISYHITIKLGSAISFHNEKYRYIIIFFILHNLHDITDVIRAFNKKKLKHFIKILKDEKLSSLSIEIVKQLHIEISTHAFAN